jgi:hypothetical protein
MIESEVPIAAYVSIFRASLGENHRVNTQIGAKNRCGPCGCTRPTLKGWRNGL